MEETVALSPLENLLLNYKDLTQDQELLKSLDYVTLTNLCQSNTRLRERCQKSDIQALLKKKAEQNAFIILKRLRSYHDKIKVDMIIQYPKSPKLLQTTLLDLEFRIGRPSIISGSTIDSDIESLVNGVPFFTRYVDLGPSYMARYDPRRDLVSLEVQPRPIKRFLFKAQLYHRILVSILELYNLEYAIALEKGMSVIGSQEKIYIHV